METAKQLCFAALQDFASTNAAVEYVALVAFPHHGKAYLVEFAVGSMQPEFKNESIWYVSQWGPGSRLQTRFLD